MLVSISVPSAALEPNSFEAFTHPLSFHFLQFDPHQLVLMLQFLNLSDFPSLIFQFRVLFFQDKQLLVDV